ncbi:MAG: helix-turn-helix domain-containing protein [Deltaproteobacteria bacterium]|nr:helix-turn-helix domain-containing protein [Deltaproteobacteria bacterium]
MLQSDQLGIALRLLRTTRNLKQHQVAGCAGITSSMLSGYENGRKVPTLASLEKILEAMGCRLQDLVAALEMTRRKSGGVADRGSEPGVLERDHRGREPAPSSPPLPWSQEAFRPAGSRAFDLDAILGPSPCLAQEEQEAFEEMLSGYYRWLRFLHRHGDVARGS